MAKPASHAVACVGLCLIVEVGYRVRTFVDGPWQSRSTETNTSGCGGSSPYWCPKRRL